MFFENYIKNSTKREHNKIFRPWDCVASDDTAQDSTVSTTTECDDTAAEKPKDNNLKIDQNCVSESVLKISEVKNSEGIKKETDVNITEKDYCKEKSKENISKRYRNIERETGVVLKNSVPFEGYPYYPEIMHANLAQSLGVPSADPFLLESLAHNYSLEEYARVLTQDQHAKLLNSRKQRPKKYRCPHCNVGFSNNGQLKGHIRIHTGRFLYLENNNLILTIHQHVVNINLFH